MDWDFAADARLTHDQAAAVDRGAVRDVLLEQDLLRIHPRRKRATQSDHNTSPLPVQSALGAGTILAAAAVLASPMVGEAPDPRQPSLPTVQHHNEEAHSSANNPSDCGKN